MRTFSAQMTEFYQVWSQLPLCCPFNHFLRYPVPPIIRSPLVVLDCDERKFLYSAGPNVGRNLSKPSWRFLDLLDASGERFRKGFRGFAVKPDSVEV